MSLKLIASLLLSLLFILKGHAESNPPLFLDHVVIVVEDLSKATKDFTELGFTVVPGGKHSGDFDHNALIILADGTYLELYAPLQPSMMAKLQDLKKQGTLNTITSHLNAIKSRFVDHIASGEGLADFALSSPELNLDKEIDILNQKDLALMGPILMDRIRSDDQKVIWRVAVPQTNSLPFLIEDVTPKSLRVGDKKATLQNNGVIGVADIVIAVQNLEKSIRRYQDLLGITPLKVSNATDAKIAVFKLGKTTIHLAEPIDQESNLYRFLKLHGEGPYSLALFTTNKDFIGKTDSTFSHHARIDLVAAE